MINWIIENWSYILSGLLGAIVVASIVVKLTPTTKDDSVLGKIVGILDKISIAKTANDKAMINIAKSYLPSDQSEDK